MAKQATYITIGMHLPDPADSNITRYKQFPMKHRVMQYLLAGHLDHVWSAYNLPDPEEPDDSDWGQDALFEGCCPLCCGPCWALKQLVTDGTLELLLGDIVKSSFYWDAERQEVSRAWLNDAWKMTSCHAHMTEEELRELQDA